MKMLLICSFNIGCSSGLVPRYSSVQYVLDQLFLVQGEVKPQSTCRSVLHSDYASVELDGMLDDRQAETCASQLTGAAFVHAIESFEKAGKLFAINAASVILEKYSAIVVVVLCKRDIDVLSTGVGQGIFCEIPEY